MEEDAKVTLKLMIDTTSNRVLFAEANKDFVDFVFHIMSLPIGTVTRLLSSNNTNMVGSLDHLYNSIKSLGLNFIQPNVSKDALLKPISISLPPLPKSDSGSKSSNHTNSTPKSNKFYICRTHNHSSSPFGHAANPPTFGFEGISSPSSTSRNSSCNYVSDATGTVCPKCNTVMSVEMIYFPHKVSDNTDMGVAKSGYVKGIVTYMVMDNLEVKPISNISALSVISKFNVKDVACLVEKRVQVGLHEGIAILKASLENQSVLTTVFLENVKSAVKKEAMSKTSIRDSRSGVMFKY